ncbi:MAG TPA: hypothetical protein V6C69_09715 [Trichormus sp.]|jgi:serine/threonine protein kinase
MSQKTTVKWPSPQEYSEAVQAPWLNFSDATLKEAQVETNALGLPRSVSGSFATVFCFEHGNERTAVRCFLSNVHDQGHRYSAISRYVLADDLPCTVPVHYVEQGVRIGGHWYPILKMPWVDGLTLTEFVNKYLHVDIALSLLASYFKEMMLDLRRAGIAHGDLQHDNILIADNELRLVDYDGMYVPELAGSPANELGHVNYQHPARSAKHFSPALDNFSAWIIYASLKCLSIDPGLWSLLQGGADCMLFRRTDFNNPEKSLAFKSLLNHRDPLIRKYGCAVRLLLLAQPDEAPHLDDESLDTPALERFFNWYRTVENDRPWYRDSAR